MFKYLPTKDNSVNIATRGLSPSELSRSIWWTAPQWLQQHKKQWPEWRIPETNLSSQQLDTESEKVMSSTRPTWKLASLRTTLMQHIFMYDWICKNQSKSHKNWNPIYCWTLHLNSCTTQKHQPHGYRWPSLLSQSTFAIPVKPPRCTICTGSVGPVNVISKDVSDAKLLQQLPWLILWIESVSVTYWRHSSAICVLMERITHLRLPTHPTPLPPNHSYNMPSVNLQSLWKNCS